MEEIEVRKFIDLLKLLEKIHVGEKSVERTRDLRFSSFFTVKSLFLQKTFFGSCIVSDFSKEIWNGKCSRKIMVFVCSAFLLVLNTSNRLQRRCTMMDLNFLVSAWELVKI